MPSGVIVSSFERCALKHATSKRSDTLSRRRAVNAEYVREARLIATGILDDGYEYAELCRRDRCGSGRLEEQRIDDLMTAS